MSAAQLVALPVLLPLLGTGVKFAIGPRGPRAQRFISVGILAAVLAVAVVLLRAADRDGPQVMQAGGWPAPVGITLIADRLSALLLVISAAVTLCVLVYAIGQGIADQDAPAPLSVYHPTYLLLVAGVSNAFLAGDLFNLYVGFEILLVASYVLITFGGTAPRVRAGATYVVVGLLSSVLFLVAIGMTYAATGTLNLAQLAGRLDGLPPGVGLILQLMLLTAFAIKAAVFPLSAWLPDSYPTAPAPVTAVFAGLLTKVGIYTMLRTQTLLFPGDHLSGLLMTAALLTMLVGILGAVAQTDIKRLLSFTLVSHIGYMVFGIGLASHGGLSGAVFYVVHHITIQTTLFLTIGLIERRGGSTSMDQLGGLARISPLLAVLFFVPAMNLSGIPPLSGFLGKLGLLQAGVADGGVLAFTLVGGGVLTSLLTLYATAKVWNRAFWRLPQPGSLLEAGTVMESGEDEETADLRTITGGPGPAAPAPARGRPTATGASLTGTTIVTTEAFPVAMTAPTAALVVLAFCYTVLAGPLTALTDRTATELLDRTAYVRAVDPEGTP
jgi:multicomponent Na+:H+ antiporter subunit D